MASPQNNEAQHDREESQSSIDSEEQESHRSDEESLVSLRQRKRQKKIATDLVSALPDSLLHHILTFLDLKQAVRTSILSKRWEFLWTFMSAFSFSDEDNDDDILEFVARVHRILVLCKPGKLNKLAVEFPYQDHFAADVGAWIQFATQRKVEDLDLRLITHDAGEIKPYQLPRHLYRNTSLRNLSLSCVKVLHNGTVGWTSLKSLTLEYVELTEEAISQILSGSPVLEFLKMDQFSGIDRLNINSMSLKKLVIHQTEYESRLEISAPNIQSLHVLVDSDRKIFQLLNVSSLVSAYIDFTSSHLSYYDENYEEMSNDMKKLLLSLKHVKELELGSCCIEALSELESKELSYFASSRKVLKLDLYSPVQIMPCLSGLLRSSRDLETLFIKIKTQFSAQKFFKGERYWESLGRTLNWSLVHLKTIKIAGILDCYDPDNCVLKLVKFLLKNAMVLEKMIISGGISHSNCSSCHASPTFVKVAQELLSFPRSSPNAVIIFSK